MGRRLESKDGKGNPTLRTRVEQEVYDWVQDTKPKRWLHDLVVAEFEKEMKNAQVISHDSPT